MKEFTGLLFQFSQKLFVKSLTFLPDNDFPLGRVENVFFGTDFRTKSIDDGPNLKKLVHLNEEEKAFFIS